MNITLLRPHGISSSSHRTNNNTLFLRSSLTKDIFQKSSPLSFTGKESSNNSAPFDSTEDFLIYANKNDFLNKIPQITTYKNYIGKGFEGTVYEIPQEPRWVLKENNRMSNNINGIDKEIMPIEDKMPLINVGQPVARIELGYGQALSVYQILKMQHGNEYGIAPYPISSESFLKLPGTQKLYKHFLTQMASLPLSSYEQLIEDLKYINDCGFKPDYFNPNNFLLDGNKIKMVDTEEITDKNYQNDYGNVLYSLLIGEFYHFTKNQEQDFPSDDIKKLNTQITTKFMTAMKNKDQKFSKDNTHFLEFLKSDLSSPYFKTDDYEKKIALLKQNNLL